MLCVGNLSVVKIYIIRLKPGPVAKNATGPGLGLIMYIFTTLGFPTHNNDFHLLTTSVNAKYYYIIYSPIPEMTSHPELRYR